MGKKARKNPYCQHLLEVGFNRYRYTTATGNGYNNKDRAGPPTWRRFAPSPSDKGTEQVHPGDWQYVERQSKRWRCYKGNWANPVWVGPWFATSTAAFVDAQLANWRDR